MMSSILRRSVSYFVLVCGLWLCESTSSAQHPVRIATYNASLNRNTSNKLVADLSSPDDLQARRVAETIQLVRPDVLLINEFDFDSEGEAMALFQENYLSVAQDTTLSGSPTEPIHYPFRFVEASNTGISSGVDFDGNGSVDDFGFGNFSGQFGMALYSMFPVDTDRSRTFQTFLWKDMPDNRIPDNYTQDGIDVARLSSKSHWDLPIQVGGQTIHVLASHPTPPVFDSPVFDENGRRNADEIRFWADFIDPDRNDYIYDDNTVFGGLDAGDKFVILGDLNADPFDGDSFAEAANQIFLSPRVNTTMTPGSAGGTEDSMLEGGINNNHVGDPAFDTADFGSPGNLRVDYVLTSANLILDDSGVFWPTSDDPLKMLTLASDHRLVYADVIVPEPTTILLLLTGMIVFVSGPRAYDFTDRVSAS